VVVGVDEDKGRPGTDAVAAAHDQVAVIKDRVGDVISQEGAEEVGAALLGRILGGVNADEEQFGGEVGLKGLELGQDVVAFDRAGSPEVEEDDFAGEVGELEGGRGVEPVEAL